MPLILIIQRIGLNIYSSHKFNYPFKLSSRKQSIMIRKIEINGFKNLSDFEMSPRLLTIITGQNSTGKSSVLQSVFMMQRPAEASPYYLDYINQAFVSVRNRYQNSKNISIKFTTDKGECRVRWNEEVKSVFNHTDMPEIERDLFYLSANRIGAENVAANNPPGMISGAKGEALFSTLEREKSISVSEELVIYPDSITLSAQVNYWISEIIGIPMEIEVERRATQDVEVRYKSDGISGILPTQLGAGVSFLAKIVILCLRSKKGDVIMIENPEIHLYPLAQARLARFLAFIAASGRQLIIETHSNDMITKFRHAVYKKVISNNDVLFAYKGAPADHFLFMEPDVNGHLNIDFPDSFFDSTLKELMEMD